MHPITILSGLPFAALGALLALYIFHVQLSVYAFVGIILLIGIVKKNAIMMVDFAIEIERTEHAPATRSIVHAAHIRFRPIMITTVAALVGTLPVALATGMGSEARRPASSASNRPGLPEGSRRGETKLARDPSCLSATCACAATCTTLLVQSPSLANPRAPPHASQLQNAARLPPPPR